MAGFDPDAYLATSAQGFDPDAYLASPATPNIGTDVAKSAGIGLAKGGIGLAGMPGDIRELMAAGVNKGSQLLGHEIPAETVSGALRHVPMLGSPTSEQLQQGIEGVTGKFYEPQTTAGKFAQTAGEFAPAVLGGPEGIAAKVATRVLAPAAASTAVGEMGGGPLAQTASAIGASALSHRMVTPKPASVTPAAQELMSMGPVEALKNPAVDAVQFKPQAIEALSNQIQASLRREKFNPQDAASTFNKIEGLKTPINGVAPTIEDLQKTRERLSDLAKKFGTDDSAAATHSIKLLDKYLDAAPQSHLLAGNIAAAKQVMQESRANFAHGATAAKVEEKIRNAELGAASTHSGGNVNNATRQQLRPLLTSRTGRMGLKPDDLAAIEDTVTGGIAGNVLRATGKFLGGGGGLGMLHGSGIGGALGFAGGGPVGAAIGSVGLPLAGYGIKKLGDIITKGKANSIVQNILARSPEAQTRQAIAARTGMLQGPTSAKQIGLLSALLAARQNGLLSQLSTPESDRFRR